MLNLIGLALLIVVSLLFVWLLSVVRKVKDNFLRWTCVGVLGLRAELAARYPEAWSRIRRRRDFMAGSLGIHLKPEVLPLSNLAGYLPPYWLAPNLAMRKA